MLCAGIAATGGICVDAAAWGVVAEIGSSKQMAGVSAVSGKFAEISGLLRLQGEAPRLRRRRGAAAAQFDEVVWQRFETLGHYQSSVSKFDLLRGVCCG